MRNYNFLTWDIVNRFGNRKIHGRLSILVDTENKQIYAVPRNIEHVEFTRKLLGLENYEEVCLKASHLVPSHISVLPDLTTNDLEEKVKGFLTGISGLEIAYGVRHTKESLIIAHELTKKFVSDGGLPISDNLDEDKIEFRYSINGKRKSF